MNTWSAVCLAFGLIGLVALPVHLAAGKTFLVFIAATQVVVAFAAAAKWWEGDK